VAPIFCFHRDIRISTFSHCRVAASALRGRESSVGPRRRGEVSRLPLRIGRLETSIVPPGLGPPSRRLSRHSGRRGDLHAGLPTVVPPGLGSTIADRRMSHRSEADGFRLPRIQLSKSKRALASRAGSCRGEPRRRPTSRLNTAPTDVKLIFRRRQWNCGNRTRAGNGFGAAGMIGGVRWKEIFTVSFVMAAGNSM
jgi:hypothetical protein